MVPCSRIPRGPGRVLSGGRLHPADGRPAWAPGLGVLVWTPGLDARPGRLAWTPGLGVQAAYVGVALLLGAALFQRRDA